MLFNSFEFIIFLPTLFLLYYYVFNKNVNVQNLLILFSSYVFMDGGIIVFVLIIVTTIVDYLIGLNIPKQDSNRKKIVLLLFYLI